MRHAAVETSTAPPADAVARAEDLDRLTAALARLPDNERLAIHLHYLGDPCFSDPASVLGVSRSGYYKVLERARRRLAHLMQEVSS